MAAVYTVNVTGIRRTRAQIAKLDQAITSLRTTQYSPLSSVTVASSIGVSDLLVTKIDALEGRIQEVVVKAMDASVKLGKEYQTYALVMAVTPKGLSGKPAGRNSAGRDDTGEMIDAISTNVELFKGPDSAQITGWHGWGLDEGGRRKRYYSIQEKGNSRIEAANSLGKSIPTVRENLKKELDKLR